MKYTILDPDLLSGACGRAILMDFLRCIWLKSGSCPIRTHSFWTSSNSDRITFSSHFGWKLPGMRID